jgi:hypothetical protein
MSIGLQDIFEPMLSALLAISPIESFFARFCILLPLTFALDTSRSSLISGLLVARDLF